VALAWAERVTRVAEGGIAEADYQAAASEFNDKELTDLTYAIGLMNAYNRFGVALVCGQRLRCKQRGRRLQIYYGL
jgi:hypothetical protein